MEASLSLSLALSEDGASPYARLPYEYGIGGKKRKKKGLIYFVLIFFRTRVRKRCGLIVCFTCTDVIKN